MGLEGGWRGVWREVVGAFGGRLKGGAWRVVGGALGGSLEGVWREVGGALGGRFEGGLGNAGYLRLERRSL